VGCQSEVTLGSNLTFSITTHDPATGVVTDAGSAPSYRVYEDETTTAILSGTMAKLDDSNTTGFYSEQIACTTANGFEVNKSYNVYISATVDSDSGAISYGFRVMTPIAKRVTELLPSDYEDSAAKSSMAWVLALLSQSHKVTLTSDGDDTATLTLYKADGTTAWGSVSGLTTSSSGDVITGVEDTV